MSTEAERQEQRVAEIQSIQAMKDMPGFAVLRNKIAIALKGSEKTVPLGESNWQIKQAHAHGYADAMDYLETWLDNCLKAQFKPRTDPRKPF